MIGGTRRIYKKTPSKKKTKDVFKKDERSKKTTVLQISEKDDEMEDNS